MNRFYLLIGLMFFSILGFSQEVLEFSEKKPIENGYSVYFHVQGLLNDEQADAVVNDLNNDPNIISAIYFVSSIDKDRFHVKCLNTVTAEYIKDILYAHNLDYEYSSVSRNGIIENKAEVASMGANSQAIRTDVDYPGFPKYKNSGNNEDDKTDYANRKAQWVEENPMEYQQLLYELDNKNLIEIRRTDFDEMSKEKQVEILERTDKFIIK